MATTTAQLIIEYPEFAVLNEQDAAYVTAVLARAERRVSPTWPADTRDDMVYLRAAHMLALSPMGRDAKLSDKHGVTSYGQELQARIAANAVGRGRVV